MPGAQVLMTHFHGLNSHDVDLGLPTQRLPTQKVHIMGDGPFEPLHDMRLDRLSRV